MKNLFAATVLAALALQQASAQTPCRGTTLTGAVQDSTLALIPGATLTLDGSRSETSGPDGRFRFSCVTDGSHRISTTAQGFAKRDLMLTTPHLAQLDVVLQVEAVETQLNIDANAADGAATNPNATGAAQTISSNGLQALADDPDDLLRELQQLASAGGGDPASTIIAVDGFQGSSSLPPKSSIAYIKINPDQFAAEYQEPPFDGGRVEVYTKPGQKAYHGAVFTTNGSPWENASDPLSTSKAAIGKQRYGFELTGPIRKTGSDFALNLEHRSIDDFAAINAVTLNTSGNTVSTTANVATPQRLWLGTARLDWQLGAKNSFLTSYSANVNHLENLGVGGASLAETGYDSQQYEHMFRVSDVTTASAHLMHEARVSLRWDGNANTPASTTPQVQVAGAFTGGGASIGPQQIHEFNLEADDDAILTTKNHTLKFGMQLMLFDEHQELTTNFNGAYTFGGGPAPVLDANNNPIPGQTETITGIEQYRRAQLNLPGGTPTAFSNVAGNPTVNFTQTRDTFFIEDDWNIGHGVHIASGLRYIVQNNPTMLTGATPRLGILWSPDKKNRWTLHAHAGLFTVGFNTGTVAEVLREDGTHRITSTVYNPVYGNPLAGATPIQSMREFAPHIGGLFYSIENIGGTRALPHGWNLSADYYIARLWNDSRTENINSPLNGQPNGPRPGAANLNVLQTQDSGQGRANLTLVSIDQQALKRVKLNLSGNRIELLDDNDNNFLFTPQSAYSNVGELAHRSGQAVWRLNGTATFTLPKTIQLSANLNASGDSHYNITTGFDNNGDGDFNDRPQYAAPGTPGAIATPYGLLVATGGTGVFPRNQGVTPWKIYLDTNLQKAFTLTRNAKAEHQQVVTVNVRSSNVLNHTNVTQIGGVLGSPLFGVPYAADNGRRIEAGVRYSF